MTLPVNRLRLRLGIAAGIPLVSRALIELARRPLVTGEVTGPALLGSREVLNGANLGDVHVRHVPGHAGWSIVLVHGWSGCADVTWHAVIPELASGPTVYAIDLPGHGVAPLGEGFDLEDAARRIALVVDRAALQGPVALVGFSMGGAACLTGFALGLLNGVDRYVAVATADRFAAPTVSLKLWAARIFGAGDRSPFVLRDAWKRARISKREMVAWIFRNRPSRRVLNQSAAALTRFDLSEVPMKLPGRTEWVVADADGVLPVEEQLASARRHGVSVRRIDSTHAVALEHPIDLARLLLTQPAPGGGEDITVVVSHGSDGPTHPDGVTG